MGEFDPRIDGTTLGEITPKDTPMTQEHDAKALLEGATVDWLKMGEVGSTQRYVYCAGCAKRDLESFTDHEDLAEWVKAAGQDGAFAIDLLARQVITLTTRAETAEAELSDHKDKFRMFVSHATGGHTDDITLPLNTLSVMASKKVNAVWEMALEKGRKEGAETAEAEVERLREGLGAPVTDWSWWIGDDESVREDGMYNLSECNSRQDAIDWAETHVNPGDCFHIIEARCRALENDDEYQPFVTTRNHGVFMVDENGRALLKEQGE